jgi:hypothetical protein
MPELHRKPRRRLDRGASEGDFTSEVEVRAAVAALRAAHATVAEAEASPEWPALHRRVTRWVLRTWTGLPVVSPEESARACARVYLVRPEFLPGMPPQRPDQGN